VLETFVWDETQEFVANPFNVSGTDKTCSQEVERLLRQGRKWGPKVAETIQAERFRALPARRKSY
jgi:hypothetical protein